MPFFSFFSHKDNLETRVQGTRFSAFISELLTNSGHFLMLNVLSEVAWMGWIHYFTDLGHYLILIGMLIQCWYLSRPQANRFWGNLIGCTIYTITDLPLDGLEFFTQLNHGILWTFSLVIAILQGIRFHWATQAKIWVIPLESLTRMAMLFALYLSLVSRFDQKVLPFFYLSVEYKFLIFSLGLVGLCVGLQTLQVTFQREQLQETATIFKDMAQWGMGTHAVTMAVTNPEKLAFERQQRAIVFMDIRGFTAWCEQTTPDQVANLLNAYYQAVEPVAALANPLKITLTADEIMAIYTTPELAVKAARGMREAAATLLAKYGLAAGCGVHCGSVVEGLFGSEEVRTYTVIGDVVNTAKRLESATPGGEITISNAVSDALGDKIEVTASEPIVAKGKSEALTVWRLL